MTEICFTKTKNNNNNNKNNNPKTNKQIGHGVEHSITVIEYEVLLQTLI